LKALLTERENEWKKREGELIAAVEAQRKSFTSLVSSKDQEIEALKHELHTVAAKRIKTLEEQVAAKDKELTEIKHRLSDKELELLELREKEYEQSSRQERLSQFAIRVCFISKYSRSISALTLLQDAQRRAAELEEQYNKLKDRYFFALAINVKMSTNNSSLDLNSLYDEAKELCLPPDQWQDWLLQKGLAKTKPSAVANDDSDSEKEDVEGF